MNKIILLGNMTRDPQVVRKKGQDGSDMVVTKFDLAVSRRQKGEQEADFFHCVSFGRQAEFVEKYFHSGSRVLVVGRVQNNNYTNRNGDKVYGFNVITEDVEFGQKKILSGKRRWKVQGRNLLCRRGKCSPEAGDIMAEGFFRSKKGFTVIQNEITRDTGISLKAKGLYLIIQAYITMPDKKWQKKISET